MVQTNIYRDPEKKNSRFNIYALNSSVANKTHVERNN